MVGLRQLLRRRRTKPAAEEPPDPKSLDVTTRNSYFGFVIGLLDPPRRKRSRGGG
jgi:hypothetical protein